MKSGFWRKDWFLGLIVVIAVLVLYNTSSLLKSLERKMYDMAVAGGSRAPAENIAIIAIDETSIANLGRWPWPRDLHAKLTDQLAAANAKVIVNTSFFFEPQKDAGLTYIDKLLDAYRKQVPAAAQTDGALNCQGAGGELSAFCPILNEAEKALNTDRTLAASMSRAANVVLPFEMTFGEMVGRPDKPLPDFMLKQKLGAQGAAFEYTKAYKAPIPALGQAAAALGASNVTLDVDGALREEALLYSFDNNVLPSLSLMTAAKSLNLSAQDIRLQADDTLQVGKLKIPLDSVGHMRTYFYKGNGAKPVFAQDSFYDVISGKIPAAKYAGKIVLIGATAPGIGASFASPVSQSMTSVEILAHSVSSILSEHFFIAPTWGGYAENLLLLLIAVYLMVLLPRLSAGMGAGITAGCLALLVAAHFGLMLGSGIWLQLMLPASLLLIGHICLTTKRFLITEAGKQKSDSESAESNRMLGLAFQGQGQLDMAFDKFRKCPLDDAVMDNLYNLALDFERKRQFNKAQSVYEYMSGHNPKFRDLEQKLQRAKTMSETIILGGGTMARSNASLLSTEGGEKPMLGRYQIEKELGKGAMGVVYQGRDPKISRIVAIKTFALSQEFEGEEVQEAKERFFREAETAGRLAHPNIVTIYDAGEEQDLCYIAMEFLRGHDLAPHTKPDNLLPPKRVMSIVARVAEALHYAHAQGIVHRDIKPANIMYENNDDVVKVTDFGIARITDSSKTKTGLVLGTPSYMSPEQLYGQKVDGRSDLFSLAVSMYQMLSGHLPFVGDSMGQLMYKIANEPTPDIRTVRSNVPAALVAVIFKGMQKDISQRYQSGEEMARDLKTLLAGGKVDLPAPPLPPAAAQAPASAADTDEGTVRMQKPQS
ncbi:serine/threonine-protein kinase [Massilia sp. W12]|uniref:CHASE2 domain-containing serine/threonine-protein kinase n=1 Tax=Massilia sp. W12 TaxID=3126507 RepID=UPI0030CF4019